jgi:DNA topoisomerase-1
VIGAKVKFEGFMKVYKIEEGDEQNQPIPELAVGEKLDLKSLDKEQKFTLPPARFTEASLIKELEKRGIGRPSTYAPTISTILDRGYVEKAEGKLVPKEIGEIVTDLLVEHFPEIVDYEFTAKMEEELDQIGEGKIKWQEVMKEFYEPFSKNLAAKTKEVSKKEITEEKTDKKCPKCGKEMIIKLGRYGKFYACSGFPECKHTEPMANDFSQQPQVSEAIKKKLTEEKCSKCGKELTIKEGRYGKFLACSGYPECKYTKNIAIESKVKCPNCGSALAQKRTKKGKMFWGCTGYPKCKTAFWDEPQEEKCPKCQSLLTKNPKTGLIKCSSCEYRASALEK